MAGRAARRRQRLRPGVGVRRDPQPGQPRLLPRVQPGARTPPSPTSSCSSTTTSPPPRQAGSKRSPTSSSPPCSSAPSSDPTRTAGSTAPSTPTSTAGASPGCATTSTRSAGSTPRLEEPAYYSDNLLCLEARHLGFTLREAKVGLIHMVGATADPHDPAVEAASRAKPPAIPGAHTRPGPERSTTMSKFLLSDCESRRERRQPVRPRVQRRHPVRPRTRRTCPGSSPTGAREFLPGQEDQTITIQFLQDFAAGKVHATLEPLYSGGSVFPLYLQPASASGTTCDEPDLRRHRRPVRLQRPGRRVVGRAEMTATFKPASGARFTWGTTAP